MDLRKLQRVIVDALDDIKAQDIQVFNTIGQTELFDRVIVATASSNRQTRALAAHVRDKVKAAGGQVVSVEGEESGEWVLVDLGDAVVHIMQPAIRAYYRLEELWGAKPVSLKVGPEKKPAARRAAQRTGQPASAPSAADAAPSVDAAAPAKRSAATGGKRTASSPAAGAKRAASSPATGAKHAAPSPANVAKRAAPSAAGPAASGKRSATSPATRAGASKRASPPPAAPAGASPRSPRAARPAKAPASKRTGST